MVDRVSGEHRSRIMSRIRGKDTAPELAVRRTLRSMGIGYRLHVRDLPGRPDIVMAGRRTVIEVRGCFWHRHPGCRFAYSPRSRTDFWEAKFAANVERDRRNELALNQAGWKVITVWECETRDVDALRRRLASCLGQESGAGDDEGHQAEDRAPAPREGTEGP